MRKRLGFRETGVKMEDTGMSNPCKASAKGEVLLRR